MADPLVESHERRLAKFEEDLGEIARELGKLDAIEKTLERIEESLAERPSRVEMESIDRDVRSLRARAHDGSKYAKVGGLVVGAVGALEVWARVREALKGLIH